MCSDIVLTDTLSSLTVTCEYRNAFSESAYVTTTEIIVVSLKGILSERGSAISILWGNYMRKKQAISTKNKKQTPWSESASELYRPSDRRLSAKLLPTCEDRGCHVVSVTDPYGRILGFLYRSRYFSIK
jgi:hypothetical protein